MFKLPNIPYPLNSLAPVIDTETMELHYYKHHQAYVDNLNKALEEKPELFNKSLYELLTNLSSLPPKLRTAVRNNGGGDYNHTFFWPLLTGYSSGKPHGELEKAINKTYGSFEMFKLLFSAAAQEVFGSGWAWLILNKAGDIEIVITHNQDAPLAKGAKPVLGLDVWEHAYYLQYQNRRPDYIDAWWSIVNWEQAEHNYRNA